MNNITTLLSPDCTFIGQPQASKKDLLDYAASLAKSTGCAACGEDVYAALMSRERLGSTGIGEGVAIPHCRVECCDSPRGILLKFDQPIEFDSLDGHPVDLVFVLITPSSDANSHLRALSYLSSLFNQANYREALRQATTSESLYATACSREFSPELISQS